MSAKPHLESRASAGLASGYRIKGCRFLIRSFQGVYKRHLKDPVASGVYQGDSNLLGLWVRETPQRATIRSMFIKGALRWTQVAHVTWASHVHEEWTFICHLPKSNGPHAHFLSVEHIPLHLI